MILTQHGIDSLKNEKGIIYKLDVNSFDISTLNDRGISWQQTNNPILTKNNSRLVVEFRSGGSQNFLILPFLQFNIDDNSDFYVNLKETLEYGAYGVTPEFGPTPPLSDYATYEKRGLRIGNYNITNLNTNYRIETIYGMKSVINRAKTNPWTTRWEYRRNGTKYDVSIYWDDVFICKVEQYPKPTRVHFTNNINGSSVRQKIYIEDLVIGRL